MSRTHHRVPLESVDVRRIRDEFRQHRFEDFLECEDRLSEAQFEAIKLRYALGLSRDEVAATIGIKPHSVSGRIRRAEEVLRAFRAELREQGFEIRRRLMTEGDSA